MDIQFHKLSMLQISAFRDKADIMSELETPFWRRKAMSEMTRTEWESLCDGCGRCCLIKLIEEDTNETLFTDLTCKLFDGQTCRCRDHSHRQNMDVNTRAPLPYTQLWKVEDCPVVIEGPSGDARIFDDAKWHPMDASETVFNGRRMSFKMFEEKWPGLVSVDEYIRSLERE